MNPVTRLRADKTLQQPNWDSYQANPVTNAALDAAEQAYHRWDAVPTGRGGVQLELHSNGWDVELEIGPDGHPLGALIGHSGDDILTTYVSWPKETL
jgi:hypothetical protein